MVSDSWAWWTWVLLGLLLLVGEILTPGGFYLIFFGVGAIIVGVISAIVAPTLIWQCLFFVLLSTASLLLFRRPLLQRFGKLTPNIPVDRLESEEAVATEEIAPQAIGKVEMRGTAWTAENISSVLIPAGARCRVERIEGLKLFISAH